MSDGAGKYYIHFDLFGLCWNWHIFPEKKFRLWGYNESWYDGPIHDFGLGPLLFVCLIDAEYIHGRDK